MSVSSVSDLSRQHMLSILGYGSTASSSKPSGTTNQSQPSSFSQMLTELQQLEESNPAQYAKVSGQISTNLAKAATNAQAQGKTAFATKLTTLSQDFATASQTGQLPNIADLAQAIPNSTSALATQSGVSKFLNNVLSFAGI